MGNRKKHKNRNLRPRTPDAAVLTQMRRLGCDFSRPRDIHSYLYFPVRENAELAGSQLRREGFLVDIQQSAMNTDWLCLASKCMVPEQEELTELRIFLTDLTQRFGGNYDGWETEVGRDEAGQD
jgi:hypothetical protein